MCAMSSENHISVIHSFHSYGQLLFFSSFCSLYYIERKIVILPLSENNQIKSFPKICTYICIFVISKTSSVIYREIIFNISNVLWIIKINPLVSVLVQNGLNVQITPRIWIDLRISFKYIFSLANTIQGMKEPAPDTEKKMHAINSAKVGKEKRIKLFSQCCCSLQLKI